VPLSQALDGKDRISANICNHNKEQNFPYPYVPEDHINPYPMALLMKSHESVHMYLRAKFTEKTFEGKTVLN